MTIVVGSTPVTSGLPLLRIIQSACMRVGIPSPNQVVGSTDTQILQLLALANEEGQEHAERYGWVSLQQETVFSTVASENQGIMEDLAPGYKYVVNDTMWNRDLNRPVYGPLSQQRWQQKKASNFAGPWNEYRIMGGRLYFYPQPVANQMIAFEYVTSNWVYATTGITYEEFQGDTDVVLLDDKIFVMGLIWRWKAMKGFDYEEDFRKYERRITDAMGRDGTKPLLNMGQARYDLQPAIVVPIGSWNV